jgi:hypothetical protein
MIFVVVETTALQRYIQLPCNCITTTLQLPYICCAHSHCSVILFVVVYLWRNRFVIIEQPRLSAIVLLSIDNYYISMLVWLKNVKNTKGTQKQLINDYIICGKKIKDKLHLPWIKTFGFGPVRCCHVLKMGPSTSCRGFIN